MEATLIDGQGAVKRLSGKDVAAQLPKEGFFWLDVANATENEIAGLAVALQLDAKLSTWLPRFGQSARFKASAQYLRVSAWADSGNHAVVQGHLLYSPAWLITVFDGAATRMDKARERFRELAPEIASHHGYALVLVLHELVTGFYPRLERAEELLDRLEEQIFLNPAAEQLVSLADLRRELSSLHRRLLPLRDRVTTVVTAIGGVPGISAEVWPSLQSYVERLADLVELINAYRQRTSEAMEGYRASVSNRQSEQINRLTIISWVFLPITFLTGYFGMNFNWAIDQLLATRDDFFLLGVGLPLLSLGVTLLLFKSLGWMGTWRRKKLQSGGSGVRGLGASATSKAGRAENRHDVPAKPSSAR
jgi:Mg2+ and Co2+ transporter CorA